MQGKKISFTIHNFKFKYGPYGEVPPERGTLCRLKPERVGISLVVVYERVGKAVRSVKGPKRANRRILRL